MKLRNGVTLRQQQGRPTSFIGTIGNKSQSVDATSAHICSRFNTPCPRKTHEQAGSTVFAKRISQVSHAIHTQVHHTFIMPTERRETSIVPAALVGLNVIGVLFGYATTIILARSLSKDGFEQYVGAIATLSLFASFGEGGFGKYALKTIPVYVSDGNGSLLAGYLRFALIGSLITSLLLGLIAAGIEIPMRKGSAEKVILLAIVFLPAMAGVGVAVDLLHSFRMPTIATIISRVLIPVTTLALIAFVLSFAELTPFRAVLCFSSGSVLGLVVSLVFCWRQARGLIAEAPVKMKLRHWIVGGSSFFALGFLTTWIFRASLVVTHHVSVEGNVLAMLAPAFETGCLILLLSKSTDKFFQPMMSLVLKTHDWTYGNSLRRSRYILVGLGVAGFLAIIFLFGKRILGLYGPGFESAYPALCLIAVGSSVWTLFSLAPTFLMFAGERRKLLFCQLGYGTLLAVLTVVLLQRFGATGAGAAYAISISLMAITNFIIANDKFDELRASDPTDAADLP